MPQSNSPESLRILICAPYGRDGELVQKELLRAGFRAEICPSVSEMCHSMGKGAGAALIADEALVPSAVQCIAEVLAHQPPWSDFPLLVMTSGGASTRASRYRLSLLEPLGNVTLLERPLRPVTLVSAVRSALRARRHQYQLSEHLGQIQASERALRRSEARFRFLSELGLATRSVTRPEAVTALVAKRLAEHLQVSGCAYATVDMENREINFLHDYCFRRSSATGRYPLALFGPEALSELFQGRTLTVPDVRSEPAQGKAWGLFSCFGIQAVICCPLVKDDRLVAIMAVHQALPRRWSDDEVRLVEEVVERCWACIEQERLLQELAENNRVLQRTNQDLTRANRELEEFAYVASHDLQEPLRMVKIYTQLILKRLGSEDPLICQYSDLVRQGAGRMEELIRDLLSFSRAVHMESPEVGTADLSASLQEALTVLRNRIEENGAEIIRQPLPVVRGDTAQFAHVFQNLLSNSLKYRKPEQPPKVHISAERQNGQWIMAVTDNGIGFEQRYAERIFGLFKRLHKDEYPGTGLGLAICQRIVERYGGRIWATSEPDRGATFYLSLPHADTQ